MLVAVLIEVSRKFSARLNAWFCDGLFGSVARPHELHNITAATWYALAMVIGVYFFPQHAVEAGALVLGIGDPIASIVGKTWGKTKVWGEKSLEGSLGFFWHRGAGAGLLFRRHSWWVLPLDDSSSIRPRRARRNAY